VTFGGNDLNNFSENQLTKFRAVYTVKIYRRSFMQNSIKKN